jgi:hypothetical protein
VNEAPVSVAQALLFTLRDERLCSYDGYSTIS